MLRARAGAAMELSEMVASATLGANQDFISSTRGWVLRAKFDRVAFRVAFMTPYGI